MVDLDATVVVAHSEKQSAAATFTRTFGFHPLFAFVDHDPATGAGGEVLAGLLRPGNANANSAADHITVLDQALEQLPGPVRARVVVRADGGGGTKAFLTRITNLGLQYSIGIGTAIGVDQVLLARLPKAAWTQAYDPDGRPRESAQVAELTGLLPELTGRGWPARMRVIARRERPHPGAQLRLTDVEGWRITLFATNTPTGQLADLEVRPTPGSRRGPHPRVEGPRPPQPATTRHRPEPGLAHRGDARAEPAHLDRHPRPRRAPGHRTQAAPAPTAQRCRPCPDHRPPGHVATASPLALEHRAAHRSPTPHRPARAGLTATPDPTRNSQEHRRHQRPTPP